MTFTVRGKNSTGHTVVAKDGKFHATFASEDDARNYVMVFGNQMPKRQTLGEMEAENPNIFKNPE